MAEVFASALPPTQRLVALALADHANDEGSSIWPSIDTLEAKTGLSRTAVKGCLRTFRALGLVVVEGYRRTKAHGRVPIYRMSADRLRAGGDPWSDDRGREATSVGVARRPQTLQQGSRGDPKSSLEPEPSLNKPSVSTAVDVARSKCSDESLALVDLLVNLIVENGSKKPSPGAQWYNAARLLLTEDGVAPADAEAVLRWCQGDEFWRANVLSMPKFRQKYDQLRLQSKRGRPGAGAEYDEAAEIQRLDEYRRQIEREGSSA